MTFGHNVGLRSRAHNRYVRADADGKVNTADHQDSWETFHVENHGGHAAFKSAHGKYLCATPDGVVADRDAVGEWEKFELRPHGNGVALISHAHGGKAVTMDGDRLHLADFHGGDNQLFSVGAHPGSAVGICHGGQFLRADADGKVNHVGEQREWETFHVEGHGDRVAFKSAHGKYLCATPDGVVADRDAVGDWETFEVRPHGHGHALISHAHGGKAVTADGDRYHLADFHGGNNQTFHF